MHTKAFPYIGLLGLFWGTNLVVSRFGVGQFDPLLFAGLRLGIASLTFGLVYLVSTKRHVPRNGRLLQHAAFLGVVGTALPMVSMLSSLRYQSSGITALLITTAPAFIVVAAHIFLPDEQLTRNKGIGVLLALSGAAVLAVRGESGLPNVARANPIGYGLVFVALLGETTGAIYIRKHMRELNAFDVTAVRLTAAALVALPLAYLLRGIDFSTVTILGYASLGYAAIIGAFAAQLMAFYITRRFGATAFSLTSYIIPVVAAITGVLVLHETITSWMVAGMVLIGGGIMFINKREHSATLKGGVS